MNSGIIVQKYGGSSLATDQQVAAVAKRVAWSHHEGAALIVVVSARGTTTDDLIGAASRLSAVPYPRETDQLLATGELAAAALLAIALRELNVPAVSLSGPQAGLLATGRHGAGVIATVDTEPVRDWLQRGYVVVVAGFQALAAEGDIITLGRGGSDTSAVALAVAHGARSCEIYTDVDGVHPADPRVVTGSRVLSEIETSAMAEMAFAGARVLHPRAVDLAAAYGVEVVVRNASGRGAGSTVVPGGASMLEACAGATAVTHDSAVALLVVRAGPNHPLSGADVLDALAARQIAVDVVVWRSTPAEDLHMAVCVSAAALEEAHAVLNPVVALSGGTVEIQQSVGKVCVVGTGLLSRPELTAAALAELAEHGIAADSVSCTQTRISVVVQENRVRDAVIALYRRLGLNDEMLSGHSLRRVPRTSALAHLTTPALKGSLVAQHHAFGAQLRLGRLDDRADGRLMIVPLDHSVSNGPIIVDEPLDRLVEDLSNNGVDAVVLHKGTVRHVHPRRFANMSLIVHLSASTAHAPDPDAKYLVSSVEAALRLGADAVSVHVNLGSLKEHQQIADLAQVAESCDRWNLPLLAMMYVRGPQIQNSNDPGLVMHAATLAADLGADIVKVIHPGTEQGLAALVRACPIPVVVAGGPPMGSRTNLLNHVSSVVRAGAAGVAIGRNIFRAPQPGALARQVADLVHGRGKYRAEPDIELTVAG